MHTGIDPQVLATLATLLGLVFTAWKSAHAAFDSKAANEQGIKNGEKAEVIHLLVNSKMAEQIAKVTSLEAELNTLHTLVASLQDQLSTFSAQRRSNDAGG